MSDTTPRPPRATRLWVGIYSFTAVVMAIAISVFVWLARQSHRESIAGTTHVAPSSEGREIPAERYQLLARFDAPRYVPEAKTDSPAFTRAMDLYAKRDFKGAAAELRMVLAERPDFLEARYYRAICLMLDSDNAAGVAEMRNVVNAGQSAYLERARLYLGKGLLATGDIPGARQEFESVAAMHGDFQKQAEILLAQTAPIK